ncbi:hypothetical protein OG589_39670 [Sphaerisporangium sp. NBC_01403]|uniref:hypothetical protein n=1 Tax=Sphaerisporangium sp. NBC_01403 TaxID=2903599 RepID=UPI0032443665
MTLPAFALLLTACGPEKQQPADSDLARRGPALVAVTQCFIDHHLVPASELQGRSWLDKGKIKPDPGFTAWVSTHADTVYRGKTLHTWEDEATAAWPNWQCPL